MRILWFPGNGALYAQTNPYNGGGWVSALANKLRIERPDIELGMAIPWETAINEFREDIHFYGIPNVKHLFLNGQKKISKQVEVIKSIVEDFNPDLIHVFGSEHTGGLVGTVTDIPVVLHLQGVMCYLQCGWMPYNMSWEKYVFWNPRNYLEKIAVERSVDVEKKIFSHCHHYMGRTDLDKRCIEFLSPGSTYHYCSEMLRPVIFNAAKIWSFHDRQTSEIVSVISNPLYKGGDLILRTASILKRLIGQDFVWRVYGVSHLQQCERLSKIKASDVNVIPMGIINADGLVECLSEADVFVHPSYIDNSPNTVCEAQLIGAPVIANNVGGLRSLIDSMNDGVLVPANDPCMMASYIKQLCSDRVFAERIGRNGRETALRRHNPDTIFSDMIHTYNDILGNE